MWLDVLGGCRLGACETPSIVGRFRGATLKVGTHVTRHACEEFVQTLGPCQHGAAVSSMRRRARCCGTPSSTKPLVPLPEQWQRRGVGIYLLARVADPDGKAPRSCGCAVGCFNPTESTPTMSCCRLSPSKSFVPCTKNPATHVQHGGDEKPCLWSNITGGHGAVLES